MDIPASHMRICNGCREKVVFVKVPGKRKGETTWTMIDPQPSEVGTYWVELDPTPTTRLPTLRGGRIEKRGQREGMRAAGVGLHTNHYKTCPKAEEFKRQRKSLH